MEQREDNKNDIASRRLKNLFGEALGDLSSVEETETAWQAFASRRRQERVELWYSALQQLLPWHYFCFGAFLRKTFYPKKSKCLLL